MQRRWLTWLFITFIFLGNLSVLIGLFHLFTFDSVANLLIAILLALVFLFVAPITTVLPSGAKWRPGILIVMVGIFLLPPDLTTLVAIPGLIRICIKHKENWKPYFITIGHVALGTYTGALMYQFVVRTVGLQTVWGTLVAVFSGLIVHLFVNRLISTMIVALKKNRRFLQQLRLVFREFIEGYMISYTVVAMTVMLCLKYGWYISVLGLIVEFGLLRSIWHYSNMRRWRETALTDALTHLQNRIAWNDFVQVTALKINQASLAVIDLDYFKQVNDVFGHTVGDKVLEYVGTTLKRNFSEQVGLFRYGGDEFILFYPHKPAEYQFVIDKFHAVIREMNLEWQQKNLPVRASIGIANCPLDADNITELFILADKLMYHTKSMNKLHSENTAELK